MFAMGIHLCLSLNFVIPGGYYCNDEIFNFEGPSANLWSLIWGSLSAKVSSIIVDGNWRWPRASYVIQEIVRCTPVELTPYIQGEDVFSWFLTRPGEFASKSAWEALRTVRSTVSWNSIVCGSIIVSLDGCDSVDGLFRQSSYKRPTCRTGDYY